MAGDGGRVPDVSEQRAVQLTVIEALEAMRSWTYQPPVTPLTMKKREQIVVALDAVRASDPASVLAALLAENPEATVAAIEALLTSDEQLTAAHDHWQERVGWRANRYELRTVLKASVIAACRSLLSKAPKEDGDA